MVSLPSKPPMIMPARDNVDPSAKALEINLGWFLPKKREIPQVVNDIVRLDIIIPVLN